MTYKLTTDKKDQSYVSRLIAISKIFIDHMSYLSIISTDKFIYSDNLNIFFNSISTFSFMDDLDFSLNCAFGPRNLYLTKLLISIYIYPICVTLILLVIFYTFGKNYVQVLGITSHFRLCFALISYNLQPLMFYYIVAAFDCNKIDSFSKLTYSNIFSDM